MKPKFRLLVLGAGFSRAAGMPLAKELWQELIARASSLSGRASKFFHDLRFYCQYLRDCDGKDVSYSDVDFEEFMRFLDIEHYLGLRGSDTWSVEGNEATIVSKVLIAQILFERQNSLSELPKVYTEFARRLSPHDIIVTFNYDTLVEQALDSAGVKYRLFPHRYKSIRNGSAIVDDSREEVVLLKVHGSIDWFDRKRYEESERIFRDLGAPPPKDTIFSHAEELGLTPLTDGPRFENDALRTIYRVRNLQPLYQKFPMFMATPRMLAPSSAKMMYANRVGDLWDSMGNAGSLNFGMSIIGFSLPSQDDYARQIIYSLSRNYQTVEWDNEVFGLRKSPLNIVNYFANSVEKDELTRRYRFVDMSKARIYGDGFDPRSLDAIFA